MLDPFAERQSYQRDAARYRQFLAERRIVRSDQSLTLEDPPVSRRRRRRLTEAVITAPAGRRRHDPNRPGPAFTPERARLVTDPVSTPLFDGDAVKLTVDNWRRHRVDGAPAFYAVCDLLHRHHFDGASARFGGRHRARRTPAVFARNVDVPMMIIAVGSTTQVRGALPGLTEMLGEPLATVERVQVLQTRGNCCWPAHRYCLALDAPASVRQKLMIFTSGPPATTDTGPPGPGPAAAGSPARQTVRTVLRGYRGFRRP